MILTLLDKESNTVQLGALLNSITSQCNKKAWGILVGSLGDGLILLGPTWITLLEVENI